MAVFTLDLSDDLRAKLEAYRARCGLRSEAAAVRALIESAPNILGKMNTRMMDHYGQLRGPATVPRTKVKDL